MPEQITISISQTLYSRVRNLAKQRNKPVDDVLEAAITLAEVALDSTGNDETTMAQEVAAYQAMHTDLMAQHVGKYVAIHQGQLIDYDEDELALLGRLNAHYPREVVLMKRVRQLPEPELRFRSPRFVRNST